MNRLRPHEAIASMREPDLEAPPILADFGIELDEVEDAVQMHWSQWYRQCHAVSLAIVRSGVLSGLGASRVVRGSAAAAGLNHSWIVVDDEAERPEQIDAYSSDLLVLDPTMWSYHGSAPCILQTVPLSRQWRHVPKGAGHEGFPSALPALAGQPLEIDAALSDEARGFLADLGPMDAGRYAWLASRPVMSWPAAELVPAMLDDGRLAALVPMDVAGNLTDRNPNDLYW